MLRMNADFEMCLLLYVLVLSVLVLVSSGVHGRGCGDDVM